MGEFRIKLKDAVEQETIKNLLHAQKRIAESGNARDLIRVSRYLLRLSKTRNDVLADTISKED